MHDNFLAEAFPIKPSDNSEMNPKESNQEDYNAAPRSFTSFAGRLVSFGTLRYINGHILSPVRLEVS